MKSAFAAVGLWLAVAFGLQIEPVQAAEALGVARVIPAIPSGHKWGEIKTGLGCVFKYGDLVWGSKQGTVTETALMRMARRELKREGFVIASDPDEPFSKDTDANLLIGGTISTINGQFCTTLHGGSLEVKGTTSIEVDWQVYSSIDRTVVAKGRTVGSSEQVAYTGDGFADVVTLALGDSLHRFTGSDAFAKLAAVSSSGPASITPPSRSSLLLAGSATAPNLKIADAVGSVVLILSAGGHGSGFLVSSDGYLMTAEHVVGSDKYVKVRWSDGLEGVGEVIRADKRRDVALIKTDPRGRQPLGLHRTQPQPGDTVFAIGAPLDIKNQGTVTRGVASANRIMDGFSFIQSDVTINGGNSGGPLLNDKGEVLGICDLSFRERGDVPTGINYFVPIDDALRFLSAEPR